MKANFENFVIGTKVQSFDKDGYYIMNACGIIEKHLGEGHAIIKTFEGSYYSTVAELHKIFKIEAI